MNSSKEISQNDKTVGEWFSDMEFTSSHWRACIILFIAFVIESWEMMIFIFSSSEIGAEFGLSNTEIGSLISALFLGMIPGALIWGKLMGLVGRKKCMILSIGLYGIFPILSAISASFEFLWVVRFLCGVVISGALVVTFPYFEELVPVSMRGRATVYLSSGWPLGILIAVGLTALFSDHGWRFVLGLGSIASLWSLVMWKWIPESPYWLADNGRTHDAEKSISSLSQNQFKKIGVVRHAESTKNGSSFRQIFNRSYRKQTILQTCINFCFSWGYWGMASWMPILLSERGLSAPQGLGFIALSTLFMFPGYVSASYLTGKIGRKKTMVLYVLVAAISGFAFAYSETQSQMYIWNFTLSFFSLGAWGVWNTWMAEIYNTSTRGHGVAWGISSQRIANSVAPIAIGAMLVSNSFLETVVFISMFFAVTFISALFLPETEGKILS